MNMVLDVNSEWALVCCWSNLQCLNHHKLMLIDSSLDYCCCYLEVEILKFGVMDSLFWLLFFQSELCGPIVGFECHGSRSGRPGLSLWITCGFLFHYRLLLWSIKSKLPILPNVNCHHLVRLKIKDENNKCTKIRINI